MKKTILLSVLIACFGFTSNAQWTTVCGTGDDMIMNLTNYNGYVYATGDFTTIGGVSAKYVARWDGTTWFSVDTNLTDPVHNVRVIDTDLYLNPYRQVVDSNWLRKWNGTQFAKVGAGVYLTTVGPGTFDPKPNLYEVVKYRGRLVVSGEFDRVGNQHISGIMQWNGTQWDSLRSGLSGSIDGSGNMYPHSMLVVDTDLYVLGNFKYAGGVTVNGIARWDGTSWHAVGAGFDNVGYCLGLFNGDIYAGGEFTMSGTNALLRIAKWNGIEWVSPGFGVLYAYSPALHPFVHTIGQIGSRGIFEGGFDQVIVGPDTFVANNVIAFTGSIVDTLAGGVLNANFEGLVPFDSTFLAGGAIYSPGIPAVTNISKYDFSTLGIKVVKSTEVSVSPNPFTDAITIDNAKKGSSINIYNVVGQLVFSTTITGTRQKISLPDLKPGAYVIQLSGKGQSDYKKILKVPAR